MNHTCTQCTQLEIRLTNQSEVLRILPHPWDWTPVGAMFLFAGASCRTRPEGLLIPLVALIVSDIFVVYVLYGA
jgi:hypothetical protein